MSLREKKIQMASKSLLLGQVLPPSSPTCPCNSQKTCAGRTHQVLLLLLSSSSSSSQSVGPRWSRENPGLWALGSTPGSVKGLSGLLGLSPKQGMSKRFLSFANSSLMVVAAWVPLLRSSGEKNCIIIVIDTCQGLSAEVAQRPFTVTSPLSPRPGLLDSFLGDPGPWGQTGLNNWDVRH